jgi:hypothetical protein
MRQPLDSPLLPSLLPRNEPQGMESKRSTTRAKGVRAFQFSVRDLAFALALVAVIVFGTFEVFRTLPTAYDYHVLMNQLYSFRQTSPPKSNLNQTYTSIGSRRFTKLWFRSFVASVVCTGAIVLVCFGAAKVTLKNTRYPVAEAGPRFVALLATAIGLSIIGCRRYPFTHSGVNGTWEEDTITADWHALLPSLAATLLIATFELIAVALRRAQRQLPSPRARPDGA